MSQRYYRLSVRFTVGYSSHCCQGRIAVLIKFTVPVLVRFVLFIVFQRIGTVERSKLERYKHRVASGLIADAV